MKKTQSYQRLHQRRHLLYYLDVKNLETGKSAGRLGDINLGGILLLTSNHMEPGARLSVGIVIPPSIDPDRDTLEMTVEVKWSQTDTRPDLFAVGCTIMSIEEEDKAFISHLIDRIGFSDGTKRIFLKNDQNIFSSNHS